MSNHELQSKLHDLKQLQALIEEAEQEAEAIKDTIKAHMGAQEELRAGEYKVTWKSVKSVKVDTAALRRVLPDVVERFVTESTVRRFCVA